jgi:lipopolysaccharide export system permease protein
MGMAKTDRQGTRVSVLSRYIIKEILKGALVALLVLWALVSLFTLTDELRDLTEGGYGLKHVFKYLALMSPLYIYELMPSAALLGSLFVLGDMANNREIIAMRVAGFSIADILKAVLLSGAILTVTAIAIGEFVAPPAESNARVMKDRAQKGGFIMSTFYGLWFRDGERFVNVQKVVEDGSINDVTIYEFDDDQRLHFVKHAKKGLYLEEKKWVLQGVKQTEITPKQTFSSEIEVENWTSKIDPNLIDIVVIRPESMSLVDLSNYIDFLEENNQKSQKYRLAFWGRIINPLITFVMLLVSAPFVIGIRKGVGVGARMMIGVLIGMGFNIINKTTGHLALVYDLNPVVMASLPSALMLTAAIFAISRLR